MKWWYAKDVVIDQNKLSKLTDVSEFGVSDLKMMT